jgi:hypothetical protein
MAKNGFQLIDAEMHVMEPVDLWERYIDPEFAGRAPRRLDERRWDIRTIVEGEVMAAMPGGDWPALTDAEEKALAERYAEEIARNFDPESQVRAMDKEGLDLAILFPTSAMYVTAFTTMDPRFAAAACHAYNDWLHDHIEAADPKRMFGAAAISPHDVDSAVTETRRAVAQLGMKAIFVRPNIYNDRAWHDPYYDPLWSACQELNVPVGFHETTGSRMKAAGTDRFKNMGIAHISTHSMEQMLACMGMSSWVASWSGPTASLCVSRGAVRLAAILARPDGRALRMARALWRDDAITYWAAGEATEEGKGDQDAGGKPGRGRDADRRRMRSERHTITSRRRTLCHAGHCPARGGWGLHPRRRGRYLCCRLATTGHAAHPERARPALAQAIHRFLATSTALSVSLCRSSPHPMREGVGGAFRVSTFDLANLRVPAAKAERPLWVRSRDLRGEAGQWARRARARI